MAQSIYITAKNLEGRIEGVMQDCKAAKMQAQGLGKDIRFSEETKMAAQIMLDAANKALTYLKKVKI